MKYQKPQTSKNTFAKYNFVAKVCIGFIIFLSCKEKHTLNIIGANTIKDTTYMASTEMQADRIVLVEYATGVQCPNCPAGAKILKEADESNPGRIIIVAEHGGTFTKPIEGLSKDTFGLPEVVLMFNSYFGGEPNKPAAAINRTYRETTQNYFNENRTTWLSTITDQMSIKPMMNLYVTTAYEASTDQYYVNIKGAYTNAINKKQRLTIMLIENEIIDPQIDGITKINDYKHDHVLRAFLTDYTGISLLDNISAKLPGRVFEKTIMYRIPDEKRRWKIENMNIVAFVHNDEGVDKEVQQAAIVKLRP